MNPAEPVPGAILIRAPLGKDAILAADVLRRAEIPARICTSLANLSQAVDENAGAIEHVHFLERFQRQWMTVVLIVIVFEV